MTGDVILMLASTLMIQYNLTTAENHMPLEDKKLQILVKNTSIQDIL